MITGKDLIEWGFTPGPWFKSAIAEANRLVVETGMSDREIANKLSFYAPPPIETIKRREIGIPFYWNMDAPESSVEKENQDAVEAHMKELTRIPTIVEAAVMPDACPAGSAKGTIPVGGVVATENAIHPGFHSADICCSMAITTFPQLRHGDGKKLLDIAMAVTHFGPGGRDCELGRPSFELHERILNNPITARFVKRAYDHFGTQGDGNHFFYAGSIKSSGHAAIVTHHGSRGFGAAVYKAGMNIAEAYRKKYAPSIPKHQAWIPADSDDGRNYWEALQIVRDWTRENHMAIHSTVAVRVSKRVGEHFWNEHNFVFQKSDGLFYHAKGATPAYPGFAADTNGLTLIPLNMAEPVLITRGLNADNGLGFSPHGAGRNMSRTQFIREADASVTGWARAQLLGLPSNIDVRWFSGTADPSEMPGGYKNAAQVRAGIDKFGLAEVVDEVLPYGCIMAGHINWREAGKRLGDAA